MTSLSVSEG